MRYRILYGPLKRVKTSLRRPTNGETTSAITEHIDGKGEQQVVSCKATKGENSIWKVTDASHIQVRDCDSKEEQKSQNEQSCHQKCNHIPPYSSLIDALGLGGLLAFAWHVSRKFYLSHNHEEREVKGPTRPGTWDFLNRHPLSLILSAVAWAQPPTYAVTSILPKPIDINESSSNEERNQEAEESRKALVFDSSLVSSAREELDQIKSDPSTCQKWDAALDELITAKDAFMSHLEDRRMTKKFTNALRSKQQTLPQIGITSNMKIATSHGLSLLEKKRIHDLLETLDSDESVQEALTQLEFAASAFAMSFKDNHDKTEEEISSCSKEDVFAKILSNKGSSEGYSSLQGELAPG